MPQVVLIIPCEMQIGETHRRIGNLQRNFKKKCQIENANSQDEFRQRNRENEP
jgi:hypothetical protein